VSEHKWLTEKQIEWAEKGRMKHEQKSLLGVGVMGDMRNRGRSREGLWATCRILFGFVIGYLLVELFK